MTSREAQRRARELGVDLVEITAKANPPVVKLIDWGKFQYQQMKEAARNRKKAREKQSEQKTMKIGLKISDNDLNIKVRKIKSFLEDGDRVKLMIVFRGREMAHKDLGSELLDRVIALLSEDESLNIALEGKPNFAGRNLSVGIRKK
jgi:translation initiation factor IF-3